MSDPTTSSSQMLDRREFLRSIAIAAALPFPAIPREPVAAGDRIPGKPAGEPGTVALRINRAIEVRIHAGARQLRVPRIATTLAAAANGVLLAIGKRVRGLPIRLESLFS